MYRNMVLFLLDLIFICGEPGFWSRIPPVRRWQWYHCANPTEWNSISSIHRNFILLHHCSNDKNNLPALDLNQDTSIGNSRRYPLHHRHCMLLHMSEYIYFHFAKATRNLATSQVQTPLCPLLQTPPRAHNWPAELPPPFGCGKSANLQTANCILRPIYICTGVADWSVIFIVVIGDHYFACGVKFLHMHQDTYNYYAFSHRILSYLVFHYKTPPAPFNQRTAVMSA